MCKSGLLFKATKVSSIRDASAILDENSNIYLWWNSSDDYVALAPSYESNLETAIQNRDHFVSGKTTGEPFWLLDTVPTIMSEDTEGAGSRAAIIVDLVLAENRICALTNEGQVWTHPIGHPLDPWPVEVAMSWRHVGRQDRVYRTGERADIVKC